MGKLNLHPAISGTSGKPKLHPINPNSSGDIQVIAGDGGNEINAAASANFFSESQVVLDSQVGTFGPLESGGAPLAYTASPDNNLFSMPSPGVLQYDGTEEKVFIVTGSATIANDTRPLGDPATSQFWELALRRTRGVTSEDRGLAFAFGETLVPSPGPATQHLTARASFSLQPGDTIQLVWQRAVEATFSDCRTASISVN